MIYYCADDYGVTKNGSTHIEECLENGILNKVSVVPNGKIADFKNRLKERGATISLHLNLVEGKGVAPWVEIPFLVDDDGYFRFSFGGLLMASILNKREFERQVYKEIRSQLRLWKKEMAGEPICIDSHQHTHMIPGIFRAMMAAIHDEGIEVSCLRFPKEPLGIYLTTPSAYLSYRISGVVKQWLLNLFALVNKRELLESKIPWTHFMGVMFSGRMVKKNIEKLLPKYIKLAEKSGRDIELCFHPGYVETARDLPGGIREDFKKFYLSPRRKMEYDTLLNFNK